MTQIDLGGRVDLALSHFMLVGLATLVAEETPNVRFWWRDGADPTPVLESELSESDVGAVVRNHAIRLSGDDSWLRATVDLDGTATTRRAVFAPRAKAPVSATQWRVYAGARDAVVLGSGASALDGRFIEGLGEPAWWRVSDRESRPDDGASRWEMKTRNRGEEIVTHRLLPLVEVCAKRSVESLVDGLGGRAVIDGTGGGEGSRTATGLAPPGEVDSAVALMALLALANLPPTALRHSVSLTPGLGPGQRTHPTRSVLPVYTRPTTARRWGQVMRSPAMSKLVREPVGGEALDARGWLKEQGVAGVLMCVVEKRGSASAPERWVLPGDLDMW